ncbi:hypothetical protein MVEN_02189500 [Mycena venus]|uniref:Uncharacterized protein n=1 Tax=Mycena venus TaxID=2733690 RepID=A0A8H6X9F1_9AGAR|nr:hypothetical protein MVEN_02189500 [Mycena venus]
MDVPSPHPFHKATTSPGRPAALVSTLMQPHHRPRRRHPGYLAPRSKQSLGYHPIPAIPRIRARASLCILADDETPPCDGGRSLPPKRAATASTTTQRPYPAVRDPAASPIDVLPGASHTLARRSMSPHSGITTIKLEAVSGAHCRIADGVIAMSCGSAFPPSSSALGSMYAHCAPYIIILHLPHALRSWIRTIADSSPLPSPPASMHIP